MSAINVKDILNIAGAVNAALTKQADNKGVSLETKDVPKVSAAVEKEVNAQAATLQKEVNAVVDHATNNEPWYLSRVTIGALVSILMPILALVGVSADIISADELTAYIAAGGVIFGGIVTLWGRHVAKKPIGQ